MKIGEFIQKVNTTKDTVRHYESLDLLAPKWQGHFKEYDEKDILEF